LLYDRNPQTFHPVFWVPEFGFLGSWFIALMRPRRGLAPSDFAHRFEHFFYFFWCHVVVAATATTATCVSLHSPSSDHLEGQFMENNNHISILMRAVTLMNI
jgi:hypothetical protein